MAKHKKGTPRKGKGRERRKRQAHRKESTPRRNHPRDAQAIDLDPPRTDLCFPPLHVDADLNRIPDPHQRLGLDAADAPTPDQIRAAWRRAIELHPPEREPEAARELTAARDRLLAPDKALERRLGVLHAPDPRAYGLSSEEAPASAPDRLGSRPRLLGQLALYALLEEELESPEPGPTDRQVELPF